jgi:hypothetical protein
MAERGDLPRLGEREEQLVSPDRLGNDPHRLRCLRCHRRAENGAEDGKECHRKP